MLDSVKLIFFQSLLLISRHLSKQLVSSLGLGLQSLWAEWNEKRRANMWNIYGRGTNIVLRCSNLYGTV